MAADKVYAPRRARAFVSQAGAAAIESPIHIRTTKLTAANIIAMFTVPISVVPAPNTGHAIVVHSVVFKMTRTATAFTGGGVVSLQYHTTTTSVPHGGTIAAAVVTTGGAGTVYHYLGPNNDATGMVLPSAEGIDITNATGVFAAGTGTAEVRVEYSVIKTV